MMYMMNHSGMEVLILVLMEYGLRRSESYIGERW